MKPLVSAYVDGACNPNPGRGAWGVVLSSGSREKHLSGIVPETETTNQRAEIYAAINALAALNKPCRVRIYSDSQYLVKTMLGDFRRRKNFDLWERLDAAARVPGHDIEWVWVRGHTGERGNEIAHVLAEGELSGLIERNYGREQLKGEVEKYLIHLKHKTEGKVGNWKIDARSGSSGGRTSTPLSWAAYLLVTHEDNVEAARRIDPILDHMASSEASKKDFILKQCIAAAQNDPGILTQWRERKSEKASYLADLFDEALDYVVDRFLERWPEGELKVHLDHRALPVRNGYEARKRGTEAFDAYILSRLEQIEREDPSISRGAAKQLLASREPWLSERMIQRAIGGPEGREREREYDRRRSQARKKRSFASKQAAA